MRIFPIECPPLATTSFFQPMSFYQATCQQQLLNTHTYFTPLSLSTPTLISRTPTLATWLPSSSKTFKYQTHQSVSDDPSLRKVAIPCPLLLKSYSAGRECSADLHYGKLDTERLKSGSLPNTPRASRPV